MSNEVQWNLFYSNLKNGTFADEEESFLKLCSSIIDHKDDFTRSSCSNKDGKFYSQVIGLLANSIPDSSSYLSENNAILKEILQVIIEFCLNQLKSKEVDTIILTKFQLVRILQGLVACDKRLTTEELVALQEPEYAVPEQLHSDVQHLPAIFLEKSFLSAPVTGNWKSLFIGHVRSILKKSDVSSIMTKFIRSMEELHLFSQRCTDIVFNQQQEKCVVQSDSILLLEGQLKAAIDIISLPGVFNQEQNEITFLCDLVEKALTAAIFVASGCYNIDNAAEKDYAYEDYCRKHGWKSVELSNSLFISVSTILSEAACVKSYVVSNLEARIILTILKGLQITTKAKQEPDSKCLVTMISHVLLLLTNLVDEIDTKLQPPSPTATAEWSLFEATSAYTRLNYINEKLALPDILCDLFITVYTKGMNLAQLVIQPKVEEDQRRESTSGEDSSIEEGSVLGSFFTNIIKETNSSSSEETKDSKDAYAQSSEIFILLASSLAEFLSKFLPACVTNNIQVQGSLTEERLDVFARIVSGVPTACSADVKESKEHISKLLVYVLTAGLLDADKIECLLKKLGIPTSVELERKLDLSSHTLAIFLRLALADTKNANREKIVYNSWKAVVEALLKSASDGSSSYLNVEHAQVMVMLHQMLNEEEKTSVLALFTEAVVRVSQVEIKGSLHIAHLLLLFDVMMYSCYDNPDPYLLKQVHHNIILKNDSPSYCKGPLGENEALNSEMIYFYDMFVCEPELPDKKVISYLERHAEYDAFYAALFTLVRHLMTACHQLGGSPLNRLASRNALLHAWKWLQHLPVPSAWSGKLTTCNVSSMTMEDHFFFVYWLPFTHEMINENPIKIVGEESSVEQSAQQDNSLAAILTRCRNLSRYVGDLLACSHLIDQSVFMICDLVCAFIYELLKKYIVLKDGAVEEVKKHAATEFLELIKTVLMLYKQAASKTRELIIWEEEKDLCEEKKEFYMDVVGVQIRHSTSNDFKNFQVLPDKFQTALQKWRNLAVEENKELTDKEENQSIPAYINQLVKSHTKIKDTEMSNGGAASLKRLLSTLTDICADLVPMAASRTSEFPTAVKPLVHAVFSAALMDACQEHVAQQAEMLTLLSFENIDDRDQLEVAVFIRVLETIDKWALRQFNSDRTIVEESTLISWLGFLGRLTDTPQTLVRFTQYFQQQKQSLYAIFKSVLSQTFTPVYRQAHSQLFVKILSNVERDGEIAAALLELFNENEQVLYAMLHSIAFNPKQNLTLLKLITNLAVQNSKPLLSSLNVLTRLCKVAAERNFTQANTTKEKDVCFLSLFEIVVTVATACEGKGHLHLVQSVVEIIKQSTETSKDWECVHTLIAYINNILACTTDSQIPLPLDYITPEVVPDQQAPAATAEEDMSGAACTFTVTKRDFMHQHWYHCHTCKMNDGTGCCNVCAKVCHKDHDVTYAKNGSFFCDCGAKEDGSCKAMPNHTSSSTSTSRSSLTSSSSTQLPPPASAPVVAWQPKSPVVTAASNEETSILKEVLKDYSEEINNTLKDSNFFDSLLHHLKASKNLYTTGVERSLSLIKSYKDQLKQQMEAVHTKEKTYTAKTLMNAISGSQEGAFDNVNLSYSGEQGTTLRQLINSRAIHRKSMCLVVSSVAGKRKCLAVAHEKGKVTILQLSGLLKLPESNQKKMTLNRLSSVSLPFTALHMTSNPLNDDFLAVTGLKDCAVLVLGSVAMETSRVTLNIKVETGNYIVKALWLPGSQVRLAVVTAEFVKIFDLAVSDSEPIHHFVVPSGKICDATFIDACGGDTAVKIAVMSSQGYIYLEALGEPQESAGAFYMTNVLTVNHPSVKDSDTGVVNGGGVSLYYSQTLKLIFFSYNKDCSFMGVLNPGTSALTKVFRMERATPNNKDGEASITLTQWDEVSGQLGLIQSAEPTTGNIVMWAIKPETVAIEEISKSLGKSTKVISGVCHHDNTKTTLIVLLDDGSLRIYNANQELVTFVAPQNVEQQSSKTNVLSSPFIGSRILSSRNKEEGKRSNTKKQSSLVKFPVDFFETCTCTEEVEYEGEDLLHVYHKQQVKSRLHTNGQYIANTKPFGFKFDVVNQSTTNAFVGIRIQVGVQSMERSPQYVEVFERTVAMRNAKNRWFDIPFTRDEIASGIDKNKVTVTFGPSSDPYGISIIDSIKVYVKPKEFFATSDETAAPTTMDTTKQTATVSFDNTLASCQPIPQSEVLLTSALCCTNQLLSLVEKVPTEELTQLSRALVCLQPTTAETERSHMIGHQTHMLLEQLHGTDYQNKKDEMLVTCMMTMFETTTEGQLDLQQLENILNIATSVGQHSKSENLVKFVEVRMKADSFASKLIDEFWKFYTSYKANNYFHKEMQRLIGLVEPLVGLLFSVMLGDLDYVQQMSSAVIKLLMVENEQISFATKRGLVKALQCQQSLPVLEKPAKQSPSPPPVEVIAHVEEVHHEVEEEIDQEEEYEEEDEDIEEIMLDGNEMEEGDLQMLLDDDSTMMEIALALSLQQNPQVEENRGGEEVATEEPNTTNNDTVNLGDDEEEGDSTTMGPQEEGEVSDGPTDGGGQGSISESPSYIIEPLAAGTSAFAKLWTQLLAVFEEQIPALLKLNGVQAIPFLQVMLILCSKLSNSDEDKEVLRGIISACIAPLKIEEQKEITERSPTSEVQLVLMRFLSVLMSRCTSKHEDNDKNNETNKSSSLDAFVAKTLKGQGLVDYCLRLLEALLPYWKEQNAPEEEENSETSSLLKVKSLDPTPDMMPFFMEQYVKSHSSDLFEKFPQLVSEMVLRIPYQIHKLLDDREGTFTSQWSNVLCEYMMISNAPLVKRQIRKLLLALSGTKEKYRFVKDQYNVKSRLVKLRNVLVRAGIKLDGVSCPKQVSITYEDTVYLTDQLAACIDIATSRNENWKAFCLEEKDTLPFLIACCYQLNEHVSSKVVELISTALSKSKQEKEANTTTTTTTMKLTCHVFSKCCGGVLVNFIKRFLLDSNTSQLRWKVHDLLHSIFTNISEDEKVEMVNLMWSLWSYLPSCGHRVNQFVDLLAYFSIVARKSDQVDAYVSKVMKLLSQANELVLNHPNASIYRKLQKYVDLDMYYLESEPCSVCNNPEVAFNNYKLSSVKSDIRFTPKAQLIKLTTHHTISKISLKISDVKKAKMVKSLVVYYNNKPVPSVVELKKGGIWEKAKKVFLTHGQTEVKVEFSFPITACNLMIEFASFYDNAQLSTESLQCPRCSATVASHPGVCGNCGENVYQCHKCRAINYDERDPYLCTLCGFSKYGKFEFTLSAHPCCTVETIADEEEREKALKQVNSALEKADQHYQALAGHRNTLETLLNRQPSQRGESGEKKMTTWNISALSTANQPTPTSHVNPTIQGLTQVYCVDCKSSFDQMSKTMQRVTGLRRELVSYDVQQNEAMSQAMCSTTPPASSPSSFHDNQPPTFVRLPSYSGIVNDSSRRMASCFGCALSSIRHCLTVLKAFAVDQDIHTSLLRHGCIKELVTHNLQQQKKEIVSIAQTLLIKLTASNTEANQMLNDLIFDKIKLCLSAQASNMLSEMSLHSELTVLRQSINASDSLWEQRLTCVFRLLLDSLKHLKAEVLETITLPCLNIIKSCLSPAIESKSKQQQQTGHVNAVKWLSGDESFATWRQQQPGCQGDEDVTMTTVDRWLRELLFAPSSSATRLAVCNIVENVAQSKPRKEMLLHLLVSYLGELRGSGENAREYLNLLKSFLNAPAYKVLMCKHGILDQLCQYLSKEVDHLSMLEMRSIDVDITQGFALYALADLIQLLLQDSEVQTLCRGKFVAEVLQCYLALRRLVVQRTKLVDESQEILLALLDQLTSGTEEKAFMKTCIEALKSCPVNDIRTPMFIFEQLCNAIYKVEEENSEFFVNLDKDPQQEDFLQGRMHGNPYSSKEQGLGPLMRDVKNKICTECELVALLEDDTGMELLVDNKIISLDLPVDQVYKRVWCAAKDNKDPMKVVYRMRGLLGDATEDMIENLDSEKQENVDEESEFQRAVHMLDGLDVVLKRLSFVRDLSRAPQLVSVILKLLEYCIKVKVNRHRLTQPHLNAMNILLATLNRALRLERDHGSKSGGASLAERVLKIMEVVLNEATLQGHLNQIESAGEGSQVELLLNQITSPYVRSNTNVLQAMMKLTPFLTFGGEEAMSTLVDHFMSYLQFNKFDSERSEDVALHLECLCMIAEGIAADENGSKLKDVFIKKEVVAKSLEYLHSNTPPQSFRASGILDSAKWRELIARASLPYVLRLLTGLLANHNPTQLLISTDSNVTVIHHLEQISSQEMVGSLAENLMEALGLFPEGEAKVTAVRKKTRDEKKALAMAMRMKQLESLGMTVTGSGQIKAKTTSSTEDMTQLMNETDQRVVCCICREGYSFYPNKILCIYTYTTRCVLDKFESKPKKTQGYSTVSHFNLIHFDCHVEAARHARTRDEWESAALQNANTKCNGLLPMWGPKISEAAFSSCLARHNSYIQECTGFREPTFQSSVHDIRLLVLKFAEGQSFSQEAGGGGKLSNMNLLPYMIATALYVVNTTRQRASEEMWLNSFIRASKDTWIQSCYDVNGCKFACLLSLFVSSLDAWKENRTVFLKRLLIEAHVRKVSSTPVERLTDGAPKEFSVYRPSLVYFGLIDRLHTLSKGSSESSEEWWTVMTTYLRNNDDKILKECEKILKFYEEELTVCESFSEFLDVMGLLSEIPSGETFMKDLLETLTPQE